MQNRSFVILVAFAMLSGLLQTAPAQVAASTRSLYQITSGTYTMYGGIWGVLRSRLPNPAQAYVLLTTDTQNGRAEMAILGPDQQTAFLTLSNGLISGSTIRFFYPASHPYPNVNEMGFVDYLVTNVAGALQIAGSTRYPPICCDIPYFFSHTNVTATPMPTLAIRVSEVELSWLSESNRSYQVQYRSEQTTNLWTDLGSPVFGNGSSASTFDKIPAGVPQRQYRVLTLP